MSREIKFRGKVTEEFKQFIKENEQTNKTYPILDSNELCDVINFLNNIKYRYAGRVYKIQDIKNLSGSRIYLRLVDIEPIVYPTKDVVLDSKGQLEDGIVITKFT